jgi:hypothetical protein
MCPPAQAGANLTDRQPLSKREHRTDIGRTQPASHIAHEERFRESGETMKMLPCIPGGVA